MHGAGSLETVKGVLLIALPLVAYFALWARTRGARWRTAGVAVLAVFTLGAVANYGIWASRQYPSHLLGYDLYHYYLSGKYRAELGTEKLYSCSIVADSELRRPRFQRVASYRDLATYRIVPRSTALAEKEACHELFSAERWQEFKKDLQFFQRIVPRREWSGIFIDRGANASPIWHLGGGLVARLVPVEGLTWAAHLDTLMLALMLGLVAWAVNPETALIALAFLVTTFSTRWPLIGGALFRYDWVAASVVSLCLLRKERPASAGAVLAWAAGSRIFPFVLLASFASKGVWDLLRTRRMERRDKRLLAGFFASGALLCALAMVDGGPSSFVDFIQKMKVHSAPENVSIMRVGLPIAAAYRGETSATMGKSSAQLPEKRKIIRQQAPLLYGLALLAAFAVFWISRHRQLSDTERLLLGFALLPLGLQVSYYYYVFLLVPLVLHASELPRPIHLAGLATVALLNAGAALASSHGVTRYLILAPGSILLSLYALALLAVTAHAVRRRARAPQEQPTSPVPAPVPR